MKAILNPHVKPTHGTIIITKEGLIAQALGIPHPPGLIPVIPKYVMCKEGPWSRGSLKFCRVIKKYGPGGLKEAVESVNYGVKYVYDGVYGSNIPYVEEESVAVMVEPSLALRNAVTGSLGLEGGIVSSLIEVLRVVTGGGVDIEYLGITGSLASGTAVSSVSDVDLIAYGGEAAERLRSLFKSEARPLNYTLVNDVNGVKVEPSINLGWRRGWIKNVLASWAGVPLEGELCKPLSSYFNVPRPSPGKVVRAEVRIRGGQETSLLYPPCVEAVGGLYVVSFEFNLGDLFYTGGRFLVKCVASEDGTTLYFGLKEYPGIIKRL